MPPREGRAYDPTDSHSLYPVHHLLRRHHRCTSMNVKMETSPASAGANDSLLNAVSANASSYSDSRRKANKTRHQRQQRKCHQITSPFYCPWSMSQSMGLGFIASSKAGNGMSISLSTAVPSSPSPSFSDIVPSPPSSPFDSGISMDCRQRLGLSFGNHDSCSSPDSESSSPTDAYSFCGDLNTLYPDLKRKNASWNESYPNPSCCSPGICTTTTAAAASHSKTHPTEADASAPASSACSKVPKVTFSEELVNEQMFEDDEESKASRIGCWTIDAERFRNRIKDAGFVLSPVLRNDHRQKVYQRLFCCHSGPQTSSTESQSSSPTSAASHPCSDDPQNV